MRKHNFSDLEDQIRDTLKTTFNAIDFAGLKNDIDDKTESALNEVKTKLKDKSEYFNEKITNKINSKHGIISNIISKGTNKNKMYIAKRPVGKVAGILYTTFGFIGSGVLGVLLLTYSVFTSFFSVFSTANYITLGLLFSSFVLSTVLALRGVSLIKRTRRFKHYVKTIDTENYCLIEDLADAIGRKNKFVVKDLNKMINLGMFPQAHIDNKQTYFMLSDDVYDDYLNSQQALKERNEAELKRQEELNDPEKKELKCALELGRNYVEQLKNANAAIHNEEISTKFSKLQNIVTQIFNHLESNPQKLSEVNKFTNHYLPITLKLVNAYKDLNGQPVQGDNIRSAKNEIEKSIDIINTAFEKLLDDLFGEVALDISTDISVLQTLFTQEGLTKDDFKK